MLKQLTQFKSTINGIENFFHFDSACPTNIAKEAILECLKWIGQIEDAQKAAAAAAAVPPPAAPEATPVPAINPAPEEPANG